MISVIIPTNGRKEALKECLESLSQQTLLPDEIIIAGGGADSQTPEFIKTLAKDSRYKPKLEYYSFGPLGAAGQRNKASEIAKGDILFFLDDDVICRPEFINKTNAIFTKDSTKNIAGVSGIITNQTYVPLGKASRFLFNLSLKANERQGSYAGKVIGPAVNFLPRDGKGVEQEVDWLSSCCSAYRKKIFLEYKFNENFNGYSFMEDVELSCRIRKKHKLINTTKARCFHKDLGGKTHENWIEIGKMQILNRWHVMTKVMDKRLPSDKCRFFYYQIYCVITESKLLFKWPELKYTLLRWWGRILGCLKLFRK
ncbi:MAG: glycosyltransferase family 2 protein [Candidatus Omnitrophica bacterium]|nr:glycosyltransferase family 2 protein [Candidatus Omnitrophota bacterium]